MTHEHESYVSIETAKLLKKAGFDWKIYTGYIAYEGGHAFTTNFQTPYNFNGDTKDLFSNYGEHKEVLSKPTLDVAQRWFREVKKISVEVKTCCWVNRYQDGKYTISYIYEIFNIDTSILPIKEDKFIRYAIDCAHNIEFQTYEEALDEGLQRCLTLLLNNKE